MLLLLLSLAVYQISFHTRTFLIHTERIVLHLIRFNDFLINYSVGGFCYNTLHPMPKCNIYSTICSKQKNNNNNKIAIIKYQVRIHDWWANYVIMDGHVCGKSPLTQNSFFVNWPLLFKIAIHLCRKFALEKVVLSMRMTLWGCGTDNEASLY